MQENYELVQRGFRILVASMSSYIGQTLHRIYKDNWWNRVLLTLSDQRDLPEYGDYAKLVDSLDVANCLRIKYKVCNFATEIKKLKANCLPQHEHNNKKICADL